MPLAYLLAVIIPPTLMIYPAVVLPSTAAIDAIGSTMGGILMVTARWRRFQGRSWWPFAITICVVWLITVIAMGINGDPASVWPGGTTWMLALLSAMIVTTIDRWTVPEFSRCPRAPCCSPSRSPESGSSPPCSTACARAWACFR